MHFRRDVLKVHSRESSSVLPSQPEDSIKVELSLSLNFHPYEFIYIERVCS